MKHYRTAKNDDVEIRIDLERPESTVEYRLFDDVDRVSTGWQGTPFQRADFINEKDALIRIDDWLEYQATT